jgi:hypothetical protein
MLSVGFDGGQLSSDAGVLVLRGVEKKFGLAARLVRASATGASRNALKEMLRLRIILGAETDCVAGHIGFEPPNPAAGYLIGFAYNLA